MTNEMESIAKIVDSLKDTKTGQALDETTSLIPRTINAILTPYRKWLIISETNFEKTSELISSKMMNVPEKKIRDAKPYIMVPALQAISYSMDSQDLRNMYANLLVSAMNSDTADSVHPAFVEIIKQMSPLDADVFSQLCTKTNRPFINLQRKYGKGTRTFFMYYCIPSLTISCISVSVSISNLSRLGLINPKEDSWYTTDSIYEPLEQSPYVSSERNERIFSPDNVEITEQLVIQKGILDITPLGKIFHRICIAR